MFPGTPSSPSPLCEGLGSQTFGGKAVGEVAQRRQDSLTQWAGGGLGKAGWGGSQGARRSDSTQGGLCRESRSVGIGGGTAASCWIDFLSFSPQKPCTHLPRHIWTQIRFSLALHEPKGTPRPRPWNHKPGAPITKLSGSLFSLLVGEGSGHGVSHKASLSELLGPKQRTWRRRKGGERRAGHVGRLHLR